MIIKATGRVGASARFDGHQVALTRSGYSRAVTGKGTRVIPVTQIAAVEWKPAGRITDGFIRFVVAGAVARRSRFGSQSNDARFDEWAVPFWRKAQPEFERLRDAVQAAISVRSTPNGAPNRIEQLRQLADLHASGVLTDGEFEQEKRRLLES